MTKSARSAFLLLATLLAMLLLALPAVAAEGTEGDDPEQVGETPPITTDIRPAVEVTVPAPDVAAADWTYRYLVPTGIALAVLVVIATTGQYFTDVVRKRYRTVDE